MFVGIAKRVFFGGEKACFLFRILVFVKEYCLTYESDI